MVYCLSKDVDHLLLLQHQVLVPRGEEEGGEAPGVGEEGGEGPGGDRVWEGVYRESSRPPVPPSEPRLGVLEQPPGKQGLKPIVKNL